MPAFRIRKATKKDLPVLHTMVRELAEFLGLELGFLATQQDLGEHLFNNPIASCLIAEMTESNAPVGYVIYYKTFSTFRGRIGIQLEDIFVREGFRRSGIGKGLLHAVCCEGKKYNCCRVQWEAPVDRGDVRSFYDSLDVPTVGGWMTYRLTDALTEFSKSARRYEVDLKKD